MDSAYHLPDGVLSALNTVAALMQIYGIKEDQETPEEALVNILMDEGKSLWEIQPFLAKLRQLRTTLP